MYCSNYAKRMSVSANLSLPNEPKKVLCVRRKWKNKVSSSLRTHTTFYFSLFLGAQHTAHAREKIELEEFILYADMMEHETQISPKKILLLSLRVCL